METNFASDKTAFDTWDNFVLIEDRGSHLMLSGWLSAYRSYGFEIECCIARVDGKIIGGFAAVVAKMMGLRFYIVPIGPIVTAGHEARLPNLCGLVPKRANVFKACYAHISLPFGADNHHLIDPFEFSLPDAIRGHRFRFIYSPEGLNWKPLNFESDQQLLESFKVSVRRDIRLSMRKGLEARLLTTDHDIKLGYDLCLENARRNNYDLRSWDDFGPSLINLCKSQQAEFLGAFIGDQLKGAILLLRSGNYFTYILGGTKREKPDLLAGHFLQWEAMRRSLEAGFDGYNISLGGSPGVVAFKNSFGTRHIAFQNAKFHWVLRPFQFKLFVIGEVHLKPHKKLISKFLAAFSRR